MQNIRLGSHIAVAVCQIICGVGVAVSFAFLSLLGALFRSGSFFLLLLAGAAWFSLLLGRGISTLVLAARSRKIVKILRKNGGHISVRSLTGPYGQPEDKLLRDLGQMLSRHFFVGMSLDTDRCEVALSDVYAPQGEPQSDHVLVQSARRPLFPILPAVAVWITYLGFDGFSGVGSIVVATVLAAVVLVALSLLSPPIFRYKAERRPMPITEAAKTGDSGADSLLNTAIGQLDQLGALSKRMTGSKIDARLKQMIAVAWEIIGYVKEHPDKARQIRQFFSYYLPTSLKLITEYASIYRQPIKPESMVQSMGKIESLLGTLVRAFQREYNNLYLDKAVDISAEIDVMEGMLRQEGLGKDGTRR